MYITKINYKIRHRNNKNTFNYLSQTIPISSNETRPSRICTDYIVIFLLLAGITQFIMIFILRSDISALRKDLDSYDQSFKLLKQDISNIGNSIYANLLFMNMGIYSIYI